MIACVLRGLAIAGLLTSCVAPTVSTHEETSSTTSSSSSAPNDHVDTTSSAASDPQPIDLPACNLEIPPVQLELFSPIPLGRMNHYDMDRDGELDVVTGRFVIDHAGDSLTIAPEVLKPEYGVPGSFTQDAVGDVLYASDTAGLLLLPDVTNGAADPIATAASIAEELDVTDVDGDGTDDALLMLPRGEGFEIWYGRTDGTFIGGPAVDIQFKGATFLGQRVAVSTTDDVALFAVDGDVLVEVDSHPSTWFLRMAEIDAGGPSPAILASWLDPQMYRHALTLLTPDAPTWTEWEYDLHERSPIDHAVIDLDDDGDLDLVLAVTELYEPYRLLLLCRSGNGYEECGVLDLDVRVENLGVLANPSRVLLSTSDDTWLLELPAPPCP